MAEDDKIHYLNFPIRFQPDGRSQAQLDSGAALDAVEPAEFYLDELIGLMLQDAGDFKRPGTRVPANLQFDAIRELSWARRYSYLSFRRVAWLFDGITRSGSIRLDDARDLENASAEMQKALANAGLVKEHLFTFSRILTDMQSSYVHAGDSSDADWKTSRQKGYIDALQRWVIVAEKIETAIKSLTEAHSALAH